MDNYGIARDNSNNPNNPSELLGLVELGVPPSYSGSFFLAYVVNGDTMGTEPTSGYRTMLNPMA